MSKRKWRDSGLNDLGISESVLRDLDSVETALGGIQSVETALEGIERANAAIEQAGDIKSVHTNLGTAVGRINNLATDIRSAEASIRATDALIPKRAVEMANDTITNATAALDRATKTGFRASTLNNLAKGSTFPTFKDTMVGRLSSSPSPFGALSDLSQGTSIASSIVKVSDMFALRAKPPYPTRISELFESKDSWSRMTPSSFSAIDVWKGMPDPKDLKGIYVPETSSSAIGLMNTIAGLGTAWPPKDHWIFNVMRQMDAMRTGLDSFMSRMRSVFDGFGRHLSGIYEFIESVDWETMVESWRIQEARRPRTKIGFAALDAYDAFYLNRLWVVDRFLTGYLGIQPSEDTREGLWRVLREAFERTISEPATWITLDDTKATFYLRVAVYNEARRVQRDREMADRIWWSEGEVEEDEEGRKLSKPALSSEDTLDFLIGWSPGPEALLIPPLDWRGHVLEMIYFEGTEQDK